MPGIDFEVGQCYRMEIINTPGFVPWLQVIFRDQEVEMSKEPAPSLRCVPASTHESDPDGELSFPSYSSCSRDGVAWGLAAYTKFLQGAIKLLSYYNKR